MKATETICARGHENIKSTNGTTFEITKEAFLTKRGDCIVAVGADKGSADLNAEFKYAAKNEGARMTITIQSGNEVETVHAWGSSQLLFTSQTDLVVRKSDYICGRTLAIRADKAAKDLPRKLVENLQKSHQKVKVTLTVESAT